MAVNRSDYNTSARYKDIYDQLYSNEYQSKYTGENMNKANNTMNAISKQKDFVYDPNADANYIAAKENYQRQGKLAMKDTMANANAKTGGYGNSYSQTAGQQIYNQYMQNLGDLQVQYEDKAYNRNKDRTDALYNELAAYLNLDDTEYNRDQTERSNYNAARDTAWNRYTDSESIDQNRYSLDRSAYENDRSYALSAASQAEAQRQNAISNALSMKDYDTLDSMGYDTTKLRSDYAKELAKEQLAAINTNSQGVSYDDLDKPNQEIIDRGIYEFLTKGTEGLAAYIASVEATYDPRVITTAIETSGFGDIDGLFGGKGEADESQYSTQKAKAKLWLDQFNDKYMTDTVKQKIADRKKANENNK